MAERGVRVVPDDVWTTEQVAAYFKVAERTIRQWRAVDASFPEPHWSLLANG